MEQVVAMVASKVGLPTDQAQKAVEAVLGYLKDNPDQIKSLVGVDLGSAGGGMMSKIGKMFGR